MDVWILWLKWYKLQLLILIFKIYNLNSKILRRILNSSEENFIVLSKCNEKRALFETGDVNT